MTNNNTNNNTNENVPEPPVVQATEVKTEGFGRKLRTCFLWTKVVVVVTLITVIVIVVLQNLEKPTEVKFLLERWTWKPPTAMLVAVSFVAGVVITLLLVFLRRSSAK